MFGTNQKVITFKTDQDLVFAIPCTRSGQPENRMTLSQWAAEGAHCKAMDDEGTGLRSAFAYMMERLHIFCATFRMLRTGRAVDFALATIVNNNGNIDKSIYESVRAHLRWADANTADMYLKAVLDAWPDRAHNCMKKELLKHVIEYRVAKDACPKMLHMVSSWNAPTH